MSLAARDEEQRSKFSGCGQSPLNENGGQRLRNLVVHHPPSHLVQVGKPFYRRGDRGMEGRSLLT